MKFRVKISAFKESLLINRNRMLPRAKPKGFCEYRSAQFILTNEGLTMTVLKPLGIYIL